MDETDEERAEREAAEAMYAQRKVGLEERLGLSETHMSVNRLRLLVEWERDEARWAA